MPTALVIVPDEQWDERSNSVIDQEADDGVIPGFEVTNWMPASAVEESLEDENDPLRFPAAPPRLLTVLLSIHELSDLFYLLRIITAQSLRTRCPKQ